MGSVLCRPDWWTAGYLSWPRTDASHSRQAAASAGLRPLGAASAGGHSGRALTREKTDSAVSLILVSSLYDVKRNKISTVHFLTQQTN